MSNIYWGTSTSATTSIFYNSNYANNTTSTTFYTAGTYSSANYHNVFGSDRWGGRRGGNYPTIQKDDREDDGI
jgi:hypothetical protein